MLRRALAPSLALVLLAGCGPSSGVPPIDPAVYLRVGSDLETEVPRAEEALRDGGYVVDARVQGRSFVAFAAHRPEGAQTHVRIVSASGVHFGLTAPERTRPELRAVRLADPTTDEHDLDGDGFEEVLVEVVEEGRPAPCVGVVRVGEGGQLREVPLGTLTLHPRACVEAVGPGFDDVGTRLWAVVRVFELAFGGTPPTVRVPLSPRDGAFVPPREGEASQHFEAERARQRERIETARAAGADEEVLRLAVELAALARFAGAATDGQLEAFDGALEGLSLGEELRAQRRQARRFVEAGWDAGAVDDEALEGEIIEPDAEDDEALEEEILEPDGADESP